MRTCTSVQSQEGMLPTAPRRSSSVNWTPARPPKMPFTQSDPCSTACSNRVSGGAPSSLIYVMCSEARVDANWLRSGRLREDSADGENDWVKIARAVGRLGELPIFIDDTSDISVMEMRAKCRRLRAEHGLALIVVDYLQLVRGSGRAENRTQEISAIARHLKGLARELDVPLMALSQLSRNVEYRDDKRPRLSDLRESGSIEAEADLVGMLYRPKYYDHGSDGDDGSNDPDWADDAELIIAKHRNGPTGVVPLVFLRRYARFESRAEGYREF